MKNVLRSAVVAIHTAVFVAGLSAQGVSRPSESQIREKIKQRITYRFEDEAHFTVAMGEAVALQCPSNTYGLGEFVIYPDGPDMIWYAYSGEITGKHYRKDGRDRKGSIEQIGYAPCVAIIQWTIQGRELKIGFHITKDKQKIAQAVERGGRERGLWSSRIKFRNLLPPVKLPELERIAGFVRLKGG